MICSQLDIAPIITKTHTNRMNIAAIEAQEDVRQAAEVLAYLETHDVREPTIAAGWTRTLIAGGTTADIDISYVGQVHYRDAQQILREALDIVHPANQAMWDIEGIWNAELAYGVHHTVDNFLLYYLNSIDLVYLASDGRLHDPTGFGFRDAASHTLHMNMYDIADGRTPTASEHVNACLENCRRIAKFDWQPTAESAARVAAGVQYWPQLSVTEVAYFTRKLATKYSPAERPQARSIYAEFGWDFIFGL